MPIIHVTMKDTDVLYDAIEDAVRIELAESGLDEEEQEAIQEIRREKYGNVASKWFRYGEYLDVEIDTDAQTIKVLGADE